VTIRPLLRPLAAWALLIIAGLVMGVSGAALYLNPQVPQASTYRDLRLQTPLRIHAADGSFIAEYGERRRIPLPVDAMPELFVRAVLDTEDKRFYEHGGIDYVTLVRATATLLANPTEIPPGASTITMQLARNISFTLEQTFLRKFKEMLLAVRLEQELTKDEILELYLNVIPFGKRAYGAEAAARTYYGKPLAELDVAQWAMLAGIPQAPTAQNPINGPERALRRRNVVLRNMFGQGSIDRATYEQARAQPISARLYDQEPELDAPWVAEWARRQTLELYGEGAYEDGLEVITSVEPRLQRAANEALVDGLNAYDRRHGFRGVERMLIAPEDGEPLDEATRERWRLTLEETPVFGDQIPALVTALDPEGFDALLASGETVRVALTDMRWARPYLGVNAMGRRPDAPSDLLERGHLVRLDQDAEGTWHLGQVPEVQGALIALRPRDGAVRALVGGYDFDLRQFDHTQQAERQPGSSFKPFMYASALAAGRTPASIYLDAPLVFEDANLEGLYRPRNDSGSFRGPVRLREAMYRSINLVSMRLLLDVGAGEVIDYVTRFGFDTRTFPRNLQLAIGGGTMAVPPLTMARAYTVFANGGHLVEPWLIDRITVQGEERVYQARPLTVCDEACRAEREAAEAAPEAAPGAGAEPAGEAAGGAAAEAPPDPLPEAPRVLDPRIAYLMHSMLGDVVRYGTARRARALERDDLGGKTGTTNEADVWFSGYQHELAATVWVGFGDNRALGDNAFGSNTALPVWIDFMETALDGVPEHEPVQPPGVVRVRIDPETGQPAPPDDPDAVFELFLSETAPTGAGATDEDAPEARPETIF
jgi:penicillin-binding protein 1A